ncbi:MAG: hypothetical protein RLP09_25190, partial [Sandaracinaceae bacterium]
MRIIEQSALHAMQVDLSATPVAAGDNLIVRFTTDDLSGSGSRDEIAIDDVTVSVPAAMST